MKNMQKYITLFLASAVLMLQGCIQDDTSGLNMQCKGAKITLSITNTTDVETRSTVSGYEGSIRDASLLVFVNDKYVFGEVIASSNLTKLNNTQYTLTTELPLADGCKVVLLANTGITILPSIPVGTSSALINDYYKQAQWTYTTDGGYLPMSGELTYNSNVPSDMYVYISVAKISAAYSPSVEDATGIFPDPATKIRFSLFNRPQAMYPYARGNSFTPASPLNYLLTPDSHEWCPVFKSTSSSTPPAENCYCPEFDNAEALEDGTAISKDEWHRDRMCVILEVTDASTHKSYYRLDLLNGNGMDETKEFLRINRHFHYSISITKVRSFGYPTVAEALANPGSNIEYEVEITGDNDNFTTSNGQYAVTTDKQRALIEENVATADNLVKFFCKPNNSIADVDTRTIKLVGADKTTVIPTTQLQMCKSDGTPISGNATAYTAADEAGYQLKFTSPAWTVLPADDVYVEICYGNIRHYVPVSAYRFYVVAPADYPHTGDRKQYIVTSYKRAGNLPVAWSAAEYSTDGGTTWTNSKPAWVSTFTDHAAAGSSTSETYNATLNAVVGEHPHNDALKATAPISGTYDLSRGGETANCYIVNAPGKYSLPLVYGNARKANGTANTNAYSPAISGANILSAFIKHDGTAITSPEITGAASAEIVWQDAKNLVTSVAVSGNTLTFTVPAANISQGNAVVAVKNAAGEVLWSWHIWVTDYKLSETPKSFVNYQGYTYKFMPINIGWCYSLVYPARSVKVRFTQAESGIQRVIDLNQLYGEDVGNNPYFQWGRKDPFVGCMLNGGTTINKTWYDGSGTQKINTAPTSTTSWTAGQNATDANSIIQKCILNPNTFCASYHMDNYYYNLWSSNYATITTGDKSVVKTVYDPSPVGYHLPTMNAFTGFTSDGQSQTNWTNINGTWYGSGYGWDFVKAGSDTVHFPLSGIRSTAGAATYVGEHGIYWTAAAKQTDFGCAFGIDGAAGSVEPLSYSTKAYGFPVRPVKD